MVGLGSAAGFGVAVRAGGKALAADAKKDKAPAATKAGRRRERQKRNAEARSGELTLTPPVVDYDAAMAAYGEAMAATREAATRQQQQQQPQQQYGAPATQYGAPQYGAPAQGQAPQYGAQGGLPPPWQVVHAPGQPRPYYYNPATGVTTWEPPQPAYAPPAQPYGAYARPYQPAQSYGATQAAAAAP